MDTEGVEGDTDQIRAEIYTLKTVKEMAVTIRVFVYFVGHLDPIFVQCIYIFVHLDWVVDDNISKNQKVNQ